MFSVGGTVGSDFCPDAVSGGVVEMFPILFASVCGGVFVLALVALGGFLIVYSFRSKRKAELSRAWPGIPGQVTASEVRRSVSEDDDGVRSVAYYPTVEYTYRVSGETLYGRRLSAGAVKGYKSKAEAGALVAAYPVHSQVTVYYNSANPREAVLTHGSSGFKTGLSIGIVCLVLTACIGCPLAYGLVNQILKLR